ncbi:MAG: DUF4290 domain-containing protein [Prevotellaceae bacterium]|nr:DUF4290 domain-containing protein [Prevotellaceae bacterium]MDY2633333.1 DUF4290 domain-containing protein [Prevotella sp.]
MNIEGLDYNTQRKSLKLSEYGREIQMMIEHAVSLPTKAERQRCAETIIGVMAVMNPYNKENENYRQKLWDHLALMSDFKLDIDYPYDISNALTIEKKPEPMPYPMKNIAVRHYGALLFSMFETLKTMPEGAERDRLVSMTANQMKQNLVQWGHGSSANEKVASDLARFTDGKIQLDLDTFVFQKMTVVQQKPEKNKKRKS